MNDIIYPVIFTYEDDVIYVGVPDLGIDNYASYGKNLEEAIIASKELMTLHLNDLEEEGKAFPKPSSKDLIILENNQELVFVTMWYPYEKAKIKTIYKKKTLSVPVWLDKLAVAKNINISQVLQRALKEELGIK
jgi:predicted RNase H-like HicB family nuclease